MHRTIETYLARVALSPEISHLIFRVAISLIFVIGGLGHFFRANEMLERINESPWSGIVRTIGDPMLLLWLSGAVFIVFGLCLALGVLTRLSAVLLFITLVPITISIHVAPGHVGPLLKNVAILGGLLHLWTSGSGSLALCPDQKPKNA